MLSPQGKSGREAKTLLKTRIWRPKCTRSCYHCFA